MSNPNFPFFILSGDFRSGCTSTFTSTHIPLSIIAIMDELTDWIARKFTLTSKEDGDIDIGSDSIGSGTEGEKFVVVGRVVSNKIYLVHSLQQNIERILRSVRGFRFQDLGENHFMLRFNHRLDRTHALEGCPWLLDRHALLLALIPPNGNPYTVDVEEMMIIVRLNNIPGFLHNPEMARKICAKFGRVIEAIPPRGDIYQPFIRVKVQMNISELLL